MKTFVPYILYNSCNEEKIKEVEPREA